MPLLVNFVGEPGDKPTLPKCGVHAEGQFHQQHYFSKMLLTGDLGCKNFVRNGQKAEAATFFLWGG